MAIERKVIEMDATGKVPGRLASEIARLLQGKHKATYSPNVDMGDTVIVTNVALMKVSAKKAEEKIYKHHSFHPGGLKKVSMKVVMEKHPERVLQMAVKNMLPKNKLQTERMKRLKVS